MKSSFKFILLLALITSSFLHAEKSDGLFWFAVNNVSNERDFIYCRLTSEGSFTISWSSKKEVSGSLKPDIARRKFEEFERLCSSLGERKFSSTKDAIVHLPTTFEITHLKKRFCWLDYENPPPKEISKYLNELVSFLVKSTND